MNRELYVFSIGGGQTDSQVLTFPVRQKHYLERIVRVENTVLGVLFGILTCFRAAVMSDS